MNCRFDPEISLKAMELMKKGLDDAGIKRHLLVQPISYRCPEATLRGFLDLPEFPFGKFFFFYIISDCID